MRVPVERWIVESVSTGGCHLPRVRLSPRKNKIFVRQSRAVQLQPAARILGMGRNKKERTLDFHKSRAQRRFSSETETCGSVCCPRSQARSLSPGSTALVPTTGRYGKSPTSCSGAITLFSLSLSLLTPLIFLKIFFTPNSQVSDVTSGSANKVTLLEVCPASAEAVLR